MRRNRLCGIDPGSGHRDRRKPDRARRAWEAKITRVEGRIDLLGVHRPSKIIQAEIDGLLRMPRADGCKAIDGPITQNVCPKVDRLRQELAASQESARLEANLVADRRELSEMPVAASVADPQSAALSRLTGVTEEALRSTLAILIAFLVELGSAWLLCDLFSRDECWNYHKAAGYASD